MASSQCKYCIFITYLCALLASTVTTDTDKEKDGNGNQNEGTYVLFNNPKLLPPGIDEDYVLDSQQENPLSKRFGDVKLPAEAENLALRLRILSNQEIGVTAMQSIYDGLPYSEAHPDYQNKLDELSHQLWDKFKKYVQLLKTYKLTLENLYESHITKEPITQRLECCSIKNTELTRDERYGRGISTDISCDLVSPSVPPNTFNPGRNLTELSQHNIHLIPSVKWQYFMSVDGIFNEFPAHNYPNLRYADCKNAHDSRHRDLFLSAVYPNRKNVIIMVDHGNSLSANQLNTAKAIAKHVLLSLSEKDRVSIISLSSQVEYPRVDSCLTHKMATLTYEAKLYYLNFLEELTKQKTATNHTLGFQEALQMVWNTLSPDNVTMGNEQAIVVYVSRGLLSSLTEAKQVLDTIAAWNGKMGHQVVINTYAVIDDGKPIMYEKSFLQDIAAQNFSKYLVERRSRAPVPVGQMTPVNTTRDLNSLLGTFTGLFNWTTSTQPQISLPIRDEVSGGVVMAMTWPCYNRKDQRLLGVVGLDIELSDVVEGVTYFAEEKNAYAFIIDRNGYTVMHPSLARPLLSKNPPMHTDIAHFETHQGFNKVRSKILRQARGSMTIEIPRQVDNSSLSNQLLLIPPPMRYTYCWKWIRVDEMDSSPFIMVVKETEDGFQVRELQEVHSSSSPQNVYHRLDLLPTDNTCLHLKELATLDTSALFLAAGAFQQSYEHLSQDETKRMVQGYLAYLSDNTDLIQNPGIKAEVRKDVAAISKINKDWVEQVKTSHLNNYIIRRYVATPSGVFRMYPGTLLNKAYDPTKREWYMRALEHPGKVTLSAPYLDVGGAGYIVTVSHTIYEGKNAALHGPHDKVVAVMGIDVTLRYFYKLLIEKMPICEIDNIRCFLMDDRGYLIAHRGLIEPNQQGPLEQKHITHKEPVVANDILTHKGLVRKKLCNSYTDRTMQRYYQFNTSLSGMVTNLVHGEHCARYLVTPVKGTNLFLGIVNQTCNMMTAFCPCSMVDRLCLNCHRMEQAECECPCECPLDMNFCTGKLLQEEDRNPSCPKYPEEVEAVTVPPEISEKLPQCFQSHCNQRKSKSDCLGVLDCEWCELDTGGATPLKEPFCSTQRVCFAGVMGAKTPYDDEVNFHERYTEEGTEFKSTPVGPVAGGLMGCFLVLALGVYCYRHRIHRQSHQYINSLPDGQMRMEHIEHLPDEMEQQDDQGNGHTNIVLATFDINSSVSPYRMNPTYRRPTNAESDLGYSTMTPHEDSEQASTTCIEPLISRDRYRPPPHSTVAKGATMIPPPPRRSRSPDPADLKVKASQTVVPPGQTVLEQTLLAGSEVPAGPKEPPRQTVLPTDPLLPHQMLANVQVHMVDTH